MVAVTTLQANGANASGYCKVGDTLSVTVSGMNGTDAATARITGPSGVDVTFKGTLSSGALDFSTVGTVMCDHEGIWNASANDAHNNSDTDSLSAFKLG